MKILIFRCFLENKSDVEHFKSEKKLDENENLVKSMWIRTLNKVKNSDETKQAKKIKLFAYH